MSPYKFGVQIIQQFFAKHEQQKPIEVTDA